VKNSESACGWVKMDEWVKSLPGGGRAAGRWSSTRASSSSCQRSFLERRLGITFFKARPTQMKQQVKIISKQLAIIMWNRTL